VADSANGGHEWRRTGQTGIAENTPERCRTIIESERYGDAHGVGDASRAGLPNSESENIRRARRRQEGRAVAEPSKASCAVANSNSLNSGNGELQRSGRLGQSAKDAPTRELVDASSNRLPNDLHEPRNRPRSNGTQPEHKYADSGCCAPESVNQLDHAIGNGRRASGHDDGSDERLIMPSAGPTNGPWRDAEWIYCRDGKFRPVPRAIESELAALADGSADDLGLVRLARQAFGEESSEETLIFAPLTARGKSRVGRLRGYGNALCAPVAQAFIESYLEVIAQ
jgi:hypothetical protein